MYIKKVEFFQNRYPKDQCLSGIFLGDMGEVSIGTPIITKLDPFMATVMDEETGVAAYYKNESTKTSVMDLRKEDPKKVNQVIARNISKMSTLHLFCSMRGCYDYNEYVFIGSNFHYRDEIPLIHSDCKRINAKRMSDVLGKDELKDISGFLSDCFKLYRYLNITITGLGISMKAELMAEINAMVNALKSAYPQSKGLLQTVDIPRVLIDVLSVSFYQLPDVIPIYDIRRTKGVVLEFTLTSSTANADSIATNCQTYRFIFSKNRDGVFSIDGEKIVRIGDTPTAKAMELVCNTLANSMPHDYALKAKSKKVEEG